MWGALRASYTRIFVEGIDAKRLWRRYIFGLALILALLLGSHGASSWVIAESDGDAQTINDSGRQRMLSQRILYFASAKVGGAAQEANAALASDMKASLELFEATHARLSNHFALSDAQRARYFQRRPDLNGESLDTLVRQFIFDARTILHGGGAAAASQTALARMQEVGPGPLLANLNGVVGQYEREARERAAAIARLQHVGLALAVCILLLEALLIFLPAQLATVRALKRLEDQAAALAEANRQQVLKTEELDALRAAAEHDALHDPLTGLANRRHLELHLAKIAEDSAACDGKVAVLHIDLDRFKQINDTLGHAAGDFVLLHVARVLKACIRDNDFVARVGGDEFVVVTKTDGDASPLEAIAARIVESLGEPVEFDGSLCRFGASVGIDIGIAHESGAALDPARLLVNADIALYRSKERGRGCVTFFTEELGAAVAETKALGDDLAAALEDGAFFPIYRPQIDAQTGALAGVAAEAAWRHPDRGDLEFCAFAPVAEQMGVLGRIEDAVLTKALADFKTWTELALEVPRIAVRVSHQCLRDPKLADRLAGPAASGRVALALDERAATADLDDAQKFAFERLQDVGVTFELTGFGVGGSTVASVLALRPKRIKLDPGLVAQASETAGRTALARAVIETAEAIGAETVAAGVATEEQSALLAELGCAALEGPLFGKPMSSSGFIAHIAQEEGWVGPQRSAAAG